MLPFVSVLILASCAFAAPPSALSASSASVHQFLIGELPRGRDNGAVMNSYLTQSTMEWVDGGDKNIYMLTIEQIIDDLANKPDAQSQAIALAQIYALIGEMSNGVPGDSCLAAAVANEYASGRDDGSSRAWLGHIASSVDALIQLSTNPKGLRYTTGPRGNCVGGGRTYQFEAVWNGIRSKASRYNFDLMEEQYCAAKRLYQAFNIRSNNVGAAVTASAVPCIVEAMEKALQPCANTLRAVANGSSKANAYAAACKKALLY